MLNKIRKKLFFITLILSPLFLLSACSTISLKEKQEEIIIDKTGLLYVKPKEFMEKCEKLEKLKDGSQKELLNLTIDTISKYKTCSNKQKELTDWINRNIKEGK